MKKYLEEYIKMIEKTKDKEVIEDLKTHITFFQHERLIHLIVTLSFVLFSVIFTFISIYTKNQIFFVISLILYIIDIFYIFHYYHLENGVQKLYKIFDKITKK